MAQETGASRHSKSPQRLPTASPLTCLRFTQPIFHQLSRDVLGTRCHCVDLPLAQNNMFSHARDMCAFQPHYLRDHSSDVHTTFRTAKSSSRAFRRYAICYLSREIQSWLISCHAI